ncbi:MAG: ADP-glyceromanno-heptose 6-epimerase [Gammaproteobacteria bacterium]|nr:ADP-glyceromanno-heptose 6-epimerase [Gammaproteobacteria bacterium]MBT5643766.1 ADP-glyceromanno-heptose 6-epimerase [Gammaproteobacteria bacterium]MBT5863932.1 ADP-glyceromanno-heptose 6-epimerase [Gammaproteobacteria bacterium]MBT6733828.1 ADP-glyceromanno-heptose 6-epimerase [Gammaproteobacteria bacterium]|tara:strand:+ start:75 stop:1031 length:957 start_codon:yes stop_codon:yes gene_type:complete
MLVITGGAGFIGSNLVNFLNNNQDDEILIVEEMDTYLKKFKNLDDLKYIDCIDKNTFINDLNNSSSKYKDKINNIFHLGACSKTTEPDRDYIMSTNLEYSKDILKYSANNKISLIYASSASVYGKTNSFIETPENESFLNHYAESKLLFDQYYRKHKDRISSQVVGLRYFNVFGPREFHKEGMFSVVYHFFTQINESDNINLFKGSHGYEDGEQRRDFIHVGDTVQVNNWFKNNPGVSGIYNVGTSKSRTFNDIANCVLDYYKRGSINYIDFPDNLESQYQAFTEADMSKIKSKGYSKDFTTLEDGVKSYLDWLSKQA